LTKKQGEGVQLKASNKQTWLAESFEFPEENTLAGKDRFIRLNRAFSFFKHINRAQTTNRQSYRASLLKSRLLIDWFAEGNPIKRDALIHQAGADQTFINRFINRYIDKNRCYERNKKIYPTKDLVAHIAAICEQSNIPYTERDQLTGIAVEPWLLKLLLNFTFRSNDIGSEMSGQFIRAELSLWDQLIKCPIQELTSSEIALKSDISKSTLTTLLETALSEQILIRHRDPDDERVYRWGLNPKSTRNQYAKLVLGRTLPELRLHSRLPAAWHKTG